MSQITIPKFYVALVLQSGKKDVTKAHLKTLRLASEKYLLQQLQSKQLPTLSNLKLSFGELSNKPKPALSRFDVYWEGTATAEFADSSSDDCPSSEGVFEAVVSALGSKEYLLNAVRQLEKSCPLSMGVEIQAKRLKRPTAGGKVQAPAFYIAFASKSAMLSHPTASERQAFIDLVHSMAHAKMTTAFPDSFEEIVIDIVKIDLDACIPDEKFNIYVELSAIASFSHDAPEPMVLFQALTQCMSQEFLTDVDAIGESCFCCICNMVMRLCVIIEMPFLVPVPPSDADGDPILIKIYIQFFIALAMRAMPTRFSSEDSLLFHECIQQFFTYILASAYPGMFVSLTLPDPKTLLNAGMPAARFNVLHEYQATVEFYESGVPNEQELMSKFVQCNVPVLVERLCGLPEPWKKFDEVTLGKAAEKPVSQEAYTGKIDVVEEPVTLEKSPTKSPHKKRIKRRVTKKEKVPPPVPKLVTVGKEDEEQEEEKDEFITVSTSDVFMAYAFMNGIDDPSKEDYDRLAAATSKYYRKHLRRAYRETFVDIQVSVRKTAYHCDIPNPDFTHYVEWDVVANFQVKPESVKKGSVSPHTYKTKVVPDSYYLCRSLIGALYQDYLVDTVCRLKNTPFAQTSRVYTEQVVHTKSRSSRKT